MAEKKRRLRSLFVFNPKPTPYQEELMAGARATHELAKAETGSQIDHYLRYLLRIMTDDDWTRHAQTIVIVKRRIRGGGQEFKPIRRVRALVIRTPRQGGIIFGVTKDGAVRNLMYAFDSGLKYYRTWQVIKVQRMSPDDARMLEHGLRTWIERIEMQA